MVHYEGLNLGLQLKRSAREEGSHNDQLTKMFLAVFRHMPATVELLVIDDFGIVGYNGVSVVELICVFLLYILPSKCEFQCELF